jgi:hypothetical protein
MFKILLCNVWLTDKSLLDQRNQNQLHALVTNVRNIAVFPKNMQLDTTTNLVYHEQTAHAHTQKAYTKV